MRKIVVFIFIVSLALTGFVYYFPIQGVWLDHWFEKAAQQHDSAYHVKIRGASLRRIFHIHFDAVILDLPQWGLSLPGQDVAIFWSRKKSFETFHIQRFLSQTLEVKGGVRYRRGSLVKAHFKVWLPQPLYQKIPNVFYKRMFKRLQDSRLGMRITYSNGLIRIWGIAGPLYEMSWKPYTK